MWVFIETKGSMVLVEATCTGEAPKNGKVPVYKSINSRSESRIHLLTGSTFTDVDIISAVLALQADISK